MASQAYLNQAYLKLPSGNFSRNLHHACTSPRTGPELDTYQILELSMPGCMLAVFKAQIVGKAKS